MSEPDPIHRCPECGAIDWGGYPVLAVTLKIIESVGTITSRELADREGLSIQAATNRLSRLRDAGILYIAEERTVPGGGTERVFDTYPPTQEPR